jgi:hypothetical protein
MKCGKILRYFLLVFLLLSSVYCYSLSPEEIEALKTLDAPILIEIILRYDQGMTDLETSIIMREAETEKRESQLNLRENRLKLREHGLEGREEELNERDKLLVIQETLFQESLVLHLIEIKRTKFIYSSGGLLIGFLLGYPVGYYQR